MGTMQISTRESNAAATLRRNEMRGSTAPLSGRVKHDMHVHDLHPWDVTPAEAIRLQEALAGQVVVENRLVEVRAVAGVDVAVEDGVARAAVVVLGYPELDVVEIARAERPVTFPYIPGQLAFREAPAVLAACEALQAEPDLLLFDGHGLAHPRRMGLACHVGLFLDKPAIGCAKSRLCGEHGEPPPDAGAWAPLRDGSETIGAVVRTRQGARPVYVSIGHKVDLETAIRWVLATCRPALGGFRGYRLPEPCRLAHRAATQLAV
jgi:deoxyribonuclease V